MCVCVCVCFVCVCVCVCVYIYRLTPRSRRTMGWHGGLARARKHSSARRRRIMRQSRGVRRRGGRGGV
jgi:hypothetical protein